MTAFFRSSSAAPRLALLAAAGAAAVLGAALWQQHLGNAPCPLCVLQRIGYLVVLAGGLLAALLGALALRSLARAAAALGVLGAAGGLGTALKHVWLVWHPGQTCGLDPLAVRIDHWTVTQWFPWMFRADGFCADVPKVFGVTLPAWSALGFVVLGGLLAVALLRRASAR